MRDKDTPPRRLERLHFLPSPGRDSTLVVSPEGTRRILERMRQAFGRCDLLPWGNYLHVGLDLRYVICVSEWQDTHRGFDDLDGMSFTDLEPAVLLRVDGANPQMSQMLYFPDGGRDGFMRDPNCVIRQSGRPYGPCVSLRDGDQLYHWLNSFLKADFDAMGEVRRNVDHLHAPVSLSKVSGHPRYHALKLDGTLASRYAFSHFMYHYPGVEFPAMAREYERKRTVHLEYQKGYVLVFDRLNRDVFCIPQREYASIFC